MDRSGPSRTIIAFLLALSGLLYRTGGGSRIRTYEARRAADLQSAAINHSAIPPQDASRCEAGCVAMEPRRGLEPLTYRLQIGCAASCATRARVECPRRDSTQKRSAGADQVLSMRPPLRNGNSAREARFDGANDHPSLQDNRLTRPVLERPHTTLGSGEAGQPARLRMDSQDLPRQRGL